MASNGEHRWDLRARNKQNLPIPRNRTVSCDTRLLVPPKSSHQSAKKRRVQTDARGHGQQSKCYRWFRWCFFFFATQFSQYVFV